MSVAFSPSLKAIFTKYLCSVISDWNTTAPFGGHSRRFAQYNAELYRWFNLLRRVSHAYRNVTVSTSAVVFVNRLLRNLYREKHMQLFVASNFAYRIKISAFGLQLKCSSSDFVDSNLTIHITL